MSPVSAFFGTLTSFLKLVSPIVFIIGGSLLLALGYGWLLEDFIVSDMLYVYAAIPALFTLIGLGKIINEKIEARCLHAHPDPPKENVMCEWEFVLQT